MQLCVNEDYRAGADFHPEHKAEEELLPQGQVASAVALHSNLFVSSRAPAVRGFLPNQVWLSSPLLSMLKPFCNHFTLPPSLDQLKAIYDPGVTCFRFIQRSLCCCSHCIKLNIDWTQSSASGLVSVFVSISIRSCSEEKPAASLRVFFLFGGRRVSKADPGGRMIR